MEPPVLLQNEPLPVLTFAKTPTTIIDEENVQIQCLKCNKISEFPNEKDDYLAHLFLEHRLVIADVEEIAALEEYLKTWCADFKTHDLEEYCTTMLLDQLPDGTPAKNEKYYLLSDILPKDFELRKHLQRERLEKALARHQFELTDRSFSKECLYCRNVITGLRAEYLEHLYNKHFLQLGKSENLVYIDELLAKVQKNLEDLICLYCKKIFKDRVTLKEHMRKKMHKRINPCHREYDRYFLVNYRTEKYKLAAQKLNKKVGNNTQTGAINSYANKPKKCNDANECNESIDFDKRFGDHEDGDSDWSDWNDETLSPLNCLFCTHQAKEFIELKEHMKLIHQLDFDASVKGLNFYQKIKVVNYVRRQTILQRCVTCNMRCDTVEQLLTHMKEDEHFSIGIQKQWDKPEFFFPTYEDDGLLYILDDNPNDDMDDTVVRIISEDPLAKINKDAERLSLENFKFL